MSILFKNIIFGPITSRRLGKSLGINLLPTSNKVCNFDCIYCECGWTNDFSIVEQKTPSATDVLEALEDEIIKQTQAHDFFDSITFSGNGEPTLHPQFKEIIDGVIALRNKYVPDVKITVITNATTLSTPLIFDTLQKIDHALLKLDAGTTKTFQQINRYHGKSDFENIVKHIIAFNGKGIIQTMLIKGTVDGEWIDNTREEEIALWLEIIKKVHPKSVMLYGIHRETPAENLEKIDADTMDDIAQKVRNAGIPAQVY